MKPELKIVKNVKNLLQISNISIMLLHVLEKQLEILLPSLHITKQTQILIILILNNQSDMLPVKIRQALSLFLIILQVIQIVKIRILLDLLLLELIREHILLEISRKLQLILLLIIIIILILFPVQEEEQIQARQLTLHHQVQHMYLFQLAMLLVEE